MYEFYLYNISKLMSMFIQHFNNFCRVLKYLLKIALQSIPWSLDPNKASKLFLNFIHLFYLFFSNDKIKLILQLTLLLVSESLSLSDSEPASISIFSL